MHGALHSTTLPTQARARPRCGNKRVAAPTLSLTAYHHKACELVIMAATIRGAAGTARRSAQMLTGPRWTSAPRCLASRFYSIASKGTQAYLEPFQKDGVEGITLITLNRPETRNALSRRMLDELEEAIETVAYDK